MTEIQKRLFALRDEGYRDFTARLIPSLDKERIIGVRAPALAALARELYKAGEAPAFMAALPHAYLEENALHVHFLERLRDFELCLAALEDFLPYIDNWATCDGLDPPVLRRDHERLLPQVRRWIASPRPYTRRFGLSMLMKHFLEEDFSPELLTLLVSAESGEYYVDMMRAWVLATALAKQYPAALALLQSGRLDRWTHNKAIQKARESRRLTPEQKQELQALKRKA